MAVKYLEKAAELEPANAVISDHLGDAYWMIGRKTEAKFQWKHALSMKSKEKELEISEVKAKIKRGVVENKILSSDSEFINQKIATIEKQ